MKKKINIIPDYIAYTDGSCNNFSMFGEGGASYVLLDSKKNVLKIWSKSLLDTTSNRAELTGILNVLIDVPDNSVLLIRTDSKYCINALTKKWGNANKDIIQCCKDRMQDLKEVYFEWVKGHNGEEFNEMADKLAESRREEMLEKFNIPTYTYKDYNRPFTDREKERLRRFNDWIENNSESVSYRDYIHF